MLHSQQQEDFLMHVLGMKTNIVVYGENTEMNDFVLSVLTNRYEENERVISINGKDSLFKHEGHVSYCESENVTKEELIKTALRMNPTSVVVQNTNAEEFRSFLMSSLNCGRSMASISSNELANTLVVSKKDSVVRTLLNEAPNLYIHVVDENGKPTLENFYTYNEGKREKMVALFKKDALLYENISESLNETLNPKPKKRRKSVEKPQKNRPTVSKEEQLKRYIRYFDERNPAFSYDQLKPLMKEAVSIQRRKAHEYEVPVGASKFGGSPDLPIGMSYPFLNDIPYTFVCQLNCKEIPRVKDNTLPSDGMLYVFHLFVDEMIPLPFDLESKKEKEQYEKAVHIFWRPESEANGLKRTLCPNPGAVEKIHPALISFVEHYTLPEPYENPEVYAHLSLSKEEEKELTKFSSGLKRLAFESASDVIKGSLNCTYDEPMHQLFGDSDPKQGEPTKELTEYPGKEGFSLFLQVDDDHELGLFWAGDGRMYYFGENGKWDTIYHIMQCG